MKKPFGSPGKASGLILRIGQCLFSTASIGVMTSASGFSTVTAFWYSILVSRFCVFLLFLSLIAGGFTFHRIWVISWFHVHFDQFQIKGKN